MMWRVLVGDDDEELRRVIATTLERAGFEVSLASNGRQLVEMARADLERGRPPDAVVSDLQMPELSGFGVLAALGSTLPRVPVILITGFSDPRAHEQARELGARAVLDKPVSMRQLQHTIAAQLDARAIPTRVRHFGRKRGILPRQPPSWPPVRGSSRAPGAHADVESE